MRSRPHAAVGPAHDPRQTAKAILMMTLAVGGFAFGDGLAKLLAQRYPVAEVVWARYFAQLLLVLPLALILGRVADIPPRRYGLQLARSFIIVGGGWVFYFALKHIPLADAYAIALVSPLIVTALSVPILGETVGIRRWLAVAAGFAGVLIVIRPGFGIRHWAMVLPLVMATGFAIMQILTRIMIRTETQTSNLVLPAAVGTVAVAPALSLGWITPDPADLAIMLLMGIVGAAGHVLIFRAFARAQASVLAPFVYTQLVWSTVFGFLLFGELPDSVTVLGGTVIVGSGLYVFYRESKLRRRPPP